MKLGLWLFAISRGIGSAREIARLTRNDDAFRWLVGDPDVSHNTPSAPRVGHEFMTDVLARLMRRWSETPTRGRDHSHTPASSARV